MFQAICRGRKKEGDDKVHSIPPPVPSERASASAATLEESTRCSRVGWERKLLGVDDSDDTDRAELASELRKLASQNELFDRVFEKFPASIRSYIAKKEQVAHAQRMFYSRFASMDEDEDEDEDDAEAGGFEDTTVGGGGCLNDEGAPGLELQHNIMVKKHAGLEASTRANDDELSYGEVTFQAMAILLHRLRHLSRPGCGESCCRNGGPLWELAEPNRESPGDGGASYGGGSFFDLGSGCGRAVIAACILHPAFERAVGIEILDGLYNLATAVLEQWNSFAESEPLCWTTTAGKSSELQPDDGADSRRRERTTIEFVNGDAFEETDKKKSPSKKEVYEAVRAGDWARGDVVLVDATCLDEATLDLIAHRAKDMPDGAFLVTITAKLPLEFYSHLVLCDEDSSGSQLDVPMNWGATEAFVYQRVRRDGSRGREASKPLAFPSKEQHQDSYDNDGASPSEDYKEDAVLALGEHDEEPGL
jgi:hypothetical protein